MEDASAGLELPAAPPEKLGAAVQAVLKKQREALRAGAAESKKDADRHDPRALEKFLALLELGYLAASADGLAKSERTALADVIGRATDGLIDAETLLLHFEDLDDAGAMFDRRERLARAAASFDTDETRAQALEFASAIAIADGKLDGSEMAVLVEIGGQMSVDEAAVEALVKKVASAIEEGLS